MNIDILKKWWIQVVALLAVITIAVGTAVWLRYESNRLLEIYPPEDPEWQGQVSIRGAVNNPGIYPFTDNDTVSELIQAAGGTTGSANLSALKLYVPGEGDEQNAQKIDINHAESWLLESLPGIGETLARRIVAYRQANGPFRSTTEITGVDGIGEETYLKIKDLITVAD
jgi:competence ComEA-like helix-hairpin-helix protein